MNNVLNRSAAGALSQRAVAAALTGVVVLAGAAAALMLFPAGPAQARGVPLGGSADRGFGASVRHNIAAQTVNPDPAYADDGVIPGSIGLRSVSATRRYLTDNIRPLPDLKLDSAIGSRTGATTTGGPAVTGQGK